jgi:NNP family nitrate/nitrite transporter-like MFS transporter
MPRIKEGYEENDKYEFRQVAILDIAYFVTFGSELAVVSMLPLFFKNTFDLSLTQAGMIAASFAFMNLFARPMGGFLSDKLSSRRKTLTFLLGGLSVGYYLMSSINSEWPIPLAIAATMVCSFFVQAGEGAVFAVVPLVKKRVTGQVAGMVGAYGNVGAVCFLTVLSFVTPEKFFLTISGCAIFCLIASLFLKEPKGSFADTHHDEVGPDSAAATGVA